MKQTAWVWTLIVVGLAVAVAAPARAQESVPAQAAAPAASEELAKKLSNPISDLVSVPFQFNWAQGVGPGEETRFILNVQPVMPFSISEDWNLIARVIAPFIGQPAMATGGVAASGLGDLVTSFFFSPIPRSSSGAWARCSASRRRRSRRLGPASGLRVRHSSS